jgi:hypothetical protein
VSSNQTNKSKDAVVPARRVYVLEKRKTGASLRQIAFLWNEQKQVKSGEWDSITHETVRKDLKASLRELNKLEKQEAEDLRRLELERLDAIQLQFWSLAIGKYNADTDQWEDKPSVSAGWFILAILKRRAELLGLDAAQKHEVKINVSELTDDELRAIVNSKG